MGQSASRKATKKPKSSKIPQISKLSLHDETFPQIAWFSKYDTKNFGKLSQLPLEIVGLIVKFVLFSSDWNLNLALVSKSFRVLCSDSCSNVCYLDTQIMNNSVKRDKFFHQRWHIFKRKYENIKFVPYEVGEDVINRNEPCKVAFYGDENVGKTTLIANINGIMTPENENVHLTYAKITKFNHVKFEDHSSGKPHMGAHITFLVFDITNPSSLEFLRPHAQSWKQHQVDTSLAVLVANKLDLQDSFSPSWKKTIKSFSEELSIPLVMCSATKFTNLIHLVYLICSYPYNPMIHTLAIQTLELEKLLQQIDNVRAVD